MNKKDLFDKLENLIKDNYEIIGLEKNLEENNMSIRFYDKYLTNELYENGVEMTTKLIKEIRCVVNNFNEQEKLSDFGVGFFAEYCDGSWMDFTLKII